MKLINEGTFGKLYSVGTENTAIKRCLSETDTSFIGAIRELNMLYLLRGHPNIVQLKGVIFGEVFERASPLTGDDRKDQRDDEVHFEFEKADFDMHDYMFGEHKQYYKPVKKYMMDALLGLEYMHQCGIIHRDIKPGNVLITKGNDIGVAQLCDFGLSKPYCKQGDQTPGVMTVCYRAPEVLMYCPDYDYKADVWSMGCLFFELIGRTNFVTEISDDECKIFKNIIRLLPMTKQEFKMIMDNKTKPFYCGRVKYKKSIRQHMGLSKKDIMLFEKYHDVGSLETFYDLLYKMLTFQPSLRYSVKQCLDHPFFDKEQVKAMRIKYPGSKPSSLILYPNCPEREWMSQTAICLFNNRDEIEWYNPRCLFQAIDIFNRYLYAIYNSDDASSPKVGEFDTNLYFMTCVYMCIKFFSSIHAPIPFSDIVQEEFLTQECLVKVKQFEGGLIKNCFQYDIYHETVYEAADPDTLDDTDISNLIVMMTMNPHLSGLSPIDVYKYYKKKLKGKAMDTLLAPLH